MGVKGRVAAANVGLPVVLLLANRQWRTTITDDAIAGLNRFGERRHVCDCDANCSRDENVAQVLLNWTLTGSPTGQELAEA